METSAPVAREMADARCRTRIRRRDVPKHFKNTPKKSLEKVQDGLCPSVAVKLEITTAAMRVLQPRSVHPARLQTEGEKNQTPGCHFALDPPARLKSGCPAPSSQREFARAEVTP